MLITSFAGGTAAAALPPFRPGKPALCGSRPLVTPYYCRLGDLLCFVFMSAYCMFDLSVYYLFLQYFDTVGWVFRPVKTVSHITYTVLGVKHSIQFTTSFSIVTALNILLSWLRHCIVDVGVFASSERALNTSDTDITNVYNDALDSHAMKRAVMGVTVGVWAMWQQ